MPRRRPPRRRTTPLRPRSAALAPAGPRRRRQRRGRVRYGSVSEANRPATSSTACRHASSALTARSSINRIAVLDQLVGVVEQEEVGVEDGGLVLGGGERDLVPAWRADPRPARCTAAARRTRSSSGRPMTRSVATTGRSGSNGCTWVRSPMPGAAAVGPDVDCPVRRVAAATSSSKLRRTSATTAAERLACLATGRLRSRCDVRPPRPIVDTALMLRAFTSGPPRSRCGRRRRRRTGGRSRRGAPPAVRAGHGRCGGRPRRSRTGGGLILASSPSVETGTPTPRSLALTSAVLAASVATSAERRAAGGGDDRGDEALDHRGLRQDDRRCVVAGQLDCQFGAEHGAAEVHEHEYAVGRGGASRSRRRRRRRRCRGSPPSSPAAISMAGRVPCTICSGQFDGGLGQPRGCGRRRRSRS